jgi:hypothetical protein
MMNNLGKVAASVVVVLVVVGLWTAAGRSQDGSQRTKSEATTNAPAKESREPSATSGAMSAEEKLVRDVYARLMRYQSAAVDERGARTDKPGEPSDYLTFALQNIHSGSLAEIYDRPLAELVTPPGDVTLSLKPVYLRAGEGPAHAYYEAQWNLQSARWKQPELVRDVPGVKNYERFTAYKVKVYLQGRISTYRAMVLYQPSQSSARPSSADILDNVTGNMNTVYKDEFPRARSPWQKYVKSSLYQAVIRAIKETSDAGKPLIPDDASIGYLPGDDASPNDQDERTIATLVECSALSVTMSSAQSIKDGDTASFNVTTSGGTPTAYAWTFSNPSNSGNNPNVTFTNGNTDSVTTDGHWFANPDRECPASGSPSASFDAVYTIKCTVTFGDKTKSAHTTLTVNAFWDPGGTTAPPTITGGVMLDFDSNRNLWYVKNSGTAARTAPVVNILIPSSSQFHTKASTHEDRHAYQYTTGMNVDLFQVADLMTHLSPLTDATQAGLQTKVNNEFIAWYNGQVAIVNQRRNAAEKDAYDVSDPIAPKYLYQNCGRFN